MKIFASDFDGTFSHDLPENLRAVRAWRREGNRFGIVTGRDFVMAAECLSLCEGECDFLLVCNGAVLLDGSGSVLSARTVHPSAAGPAFRLAEQFGALVFLVERPDSHDVLISEDPVIPTVPLCQSLKKGRICQFTAKLPDRERLLGFTAAMRRELGDRMNPQCNGLNCDVPAGGDTTKALGIREYAKQVGCAVCDVYTAGDQPNDNAMLQMFTGFAMADGAEETRRAAGRIVASVAEAIFAVRNVK